MTSMTIDSSYHSAVPAASCAPRGESIMFGNVLVGVDGTSAGRDAIALGDVLRDRDGRFNAGPRFSQQQRHVSEL